MSGRNIAELIKSSELAVMGAVLMIGLGLLGSFLAIAIDMNPSVLSGWIFVCGGLAYLFYAFVARDDGEALWRIVISFYYLFGGIFLFLFTGPEMNMKPLIFLVGTIVLLEGVTEFFIFSRLRQREGSGWIVAGAIATIFLAFIIWCLWPFSSMRLIGGFVGAEFVISGVSRLMYSLATHKQLETIAREKRLPAWQAD
jgi:uncharacterized membrane protein HdeD (DUF308 family)